MWLRSEPASAPFDAEGVSTAYDEEVLPRLLRALASPSPIIVRAACSTVRKLGAAAAPAVRILTVIAESPLPRGADIQLEYARMDALHALGDILAEIERVRQREIRLKEDTARTVAARRGTQDRFGPGGGPGPNCRGGGHAGSRRRGVRSATPPSSNPRGERSQGPRGTQDPGRRRGPARSNLVLVAPGGEGSGFRRAGGGLGRLRRAPGSAARGSGGCTCCIVRRGARSATCGCPCAWTQARLLMLIDHETPRTEAGYARPARRRWFARFRARRRVERGASILIQ